MSDKTIGVLTVDSDRPNVFAEIDITTLETIADQVARAIENARLYEGERQRAEELHLLFEATRDASTSLELYEVLESVADHLCWAAKATSVHILMLEESGERATVRAQYWGPEASPLERTPDIGTVYDLTRYPTILQAIRENRPLVTHADDPNLEPAIRDMMADFDGCIALRIPMYLTGVLRGYAVIWDSQRRHEWTDEEIRLCQTLASQAAAAIENARLYEESKKHAKNLERINERLLTLQQVSASVTSTLALHEVLKTIQQSMVTLFEKTYPPVFGLLDQEQQVIHPIIVDQYSEYLGKLERATGRALEKFGFPIEKMMPQVREALFARKPYVAKDAVDIFAHPPARKFAMAAQKALGIKALVELPLWTKDEFLGVMLLASRRDEMSDEELGLLMAFADQAAIAIANARLYEQAQARSAYLATLQRINATLRSTLPLSQVLKTVVQGAGEALGYVGSLITLPDETGERLIFGAVWGGRFVDAAVKFTGFKVVSFSLSLKAEENPIVRAYLTGELQAWSRAPERIVVGVEPTISAKLARAIERTMGAKLAACVPLRVAEKTVGVLSVFSPREQLPDEERAMLLGLADQAGLAIENARLFETEQRRAEELAVLNEIAMTVTGTLDLQEVWRAIQERVMKLLDEKYPPLFTLFNEGDQIFRVVLTHMHEHPLRRVEELLRIRFEELSFPISALKPALREALLAGKPYVADDGSDLLGPTVSRRLMKGAQKIMGVKCIVDLPLWAKGKLVGAMVLFSQKEQMPDEGMELLSAIASQAAIAIENARLYEAEQRRAEELAVLNEIGRAVSSVMQLDDLLELISQEASRVIDTSNLYIALYDAQKKEMSFPLYFEEGEKRRPEKRPSRRGITEYVINSAKPLMINHDLVSRLKELDIELIGSPSKSWLGVPMLSEDQVIGVVAIQDYQKENAYDESHLRLLSTIASQAAIAIENARLYEGERRRATQLAVINEVSRKAISILDLDKMLEEVARSICSGFDYYNVALLLVDKEHHEAVMAAVAGGFEHITSREYRQSLDQGIIGWVIRTGRSWLANDVSQDPHYIKGFLEEVLTKSELCVPIQLGEEVTGALDIQSIHLNAFDEKDVMAMETLCGQIAIAIENARLYSETIDSREKAEWYGERIRTLQEIATSMTGTLSLDEVLQRIANGALKSLSTQAVALFVVNERDNTLELKAPVTSLGKGIISRLEKMMGMRSREVKLPIKEGQNMLVDAVIRKKIILGQDFAPGISIMGPRPVHALLQKVLHIEAITVVPLLAKDKVVGAITFPTPPQEEITEEERRLITMFANQATIAIENARLFEEVGRTRDYLQNLIESSPDAIVTTDRQGRITLFSKGAEGLFDYKASEVIAQPVSNYYLDSRQGVRIMRRLLRKGRLRNYETQIIDKNGKAIPTILSASLLRGEEGAVTGTLGIIKDHTSRKRLEEELRRYTEHLKEMVEERTEALRSLNEQLEKANRLKSDFVSAVSHELRAPLFAIVGMSEMLLDRGVEERG